jgi:hypothetical protein
VDRWAAGLLCDYHGACQGNSLHERALHDASAAASCRTHGSCATRARTVPALLVQDSAPFTLQPTVKGRSIEVTGDVLLLLHWLGQAREGSRPPKKPLVPVTK